MSAYNDWYSRFRTQTCCSQHFGYCGGDDEYGWEGFVCLFVFFFFLPKTGHGFCFQTALQEREMTIEYLCECTSGVEGRDGILGRSSRNGGPYVGHVEVERKKRKKGEEMNG